MKLQASLILILMLLAGDALAQEALPRLEIGIGLFALSAPNYRGSTETSTYLLPAPYFKYRGDRVRVDDGAQGIIFESEDLLLTLSGNLSPPVDDDTPEREGMDELDATIEIGPALNYRFHRLQHSAWWVDLPLRFAYTVDSDPENIGYVFQPRLTWRKPATHLGEWKLRFNIGPLYASEDYHDYFYSVDSEDATPSRPAYSADGGFSGYRSEFTYSRRIGKFWLGSFVRYDNLSDSKIEDSPLVSETESWMVGGALAWVFHEK
jgi:outer membrane scaffolding protein for murein synthesis (MipA/OmpV family)